VRPLSWLLRLGLVVAAGALLVTSLVVAVAPRLWEAANAHEELPVDLPAFAPLARRSYVYDRNGGLIAIYELENSQPISLKNVPKRVINAFLAVEDKEFYEHDGVNVRSLIRATLSNFASEAPQQGASTITMQVVKNEYLAGLDRDGRYKVLQIHYARMLEKEMSKGAILERYLNTVFFGNNAYGIQAAAETYFGKSATELSFIESAFLAGLVRSPSGYDPINEPERSRARFVQVLDRLVDDGLVKERRAERLQREFVLPEQVQSLEGQETTRTYYTEALRDYLLNRSDILGATYEERYSAMYRGGLRIHTTFDPALQLQAEAAHDILPPNALGVDSAMLSLDTQTAAIRAMVGGDGFEAGQNEINMALAPRQTGSSIKYFILAAALQAGAEADDLIMGEAQCTIPNPANPLDPFLITDAVGAVPEVASLDQMTYDSINCAYSRLAQIVGLNRMVDTLFRMAESPYLVKGHDGDDPLRNESLQPHASFATGANEMSPLDMAAGAQSIANEGVHHEPYYVERVESADGREIYKHYSAGTQVIDRGVALKAIGVLKNVLGPEGTGRRFPLDGRPAAGKTGTQADNTNAWFVGFTPQLTTAVWVGNPTGYVEMRNIPEFSQFGFDAVQGGLIPAMLWKAYMDPAHAGLPVKDWAPPPPVPANRKPVRLFLPGMECARRIVGYDHVVLGFANPASGESEGRAGIAAAAPVPAAPPGTEPPRAEPPRSDPPKTTRPGRTTTTVPRSTTRPPPQTAYVPIYENVDATTIPPDVLDPNAPLPSVPVSETVGSC
jgi:membrane peptidoglycan carboxypeptidase